MSLNPLDLLRLRNIFQAQQGPVGNDLPSQGGITGTMPTDMPQPTFRTEQTTLGEPDPFKPRHNIQDMYMMESMNMPQRNKPGMGRRIGAILAGIAGGPSTTDAIMYAPYYRELNEWNAKMEPLSRMAQMENQSNNQDRLTWQTNENLKISRDRERRLQSAQQYKQDHPKHQLKEVEVNGQMKWAWFDPENPTIPPIDSGWKKSDLTPMEVINLNNMGRVAAAEAGRATDPNSQKVQQYIRAMQLANSDPDMAAIITLGDPGSGSFTMDEPGNAITKWLASNLPGRAGKVFDRSEAQRKYQQALEFIYGNGPNPSANSSLPAPPAAKPGDGSVVPSSPQGATTPPAQAIPAPAQSVASSAPAPIVPQQEVKVTNPGLGTRPAPSLNRGSAPVVSTTVPPVPPNIKKDGIYRKPQQPDYKTKGAPITKGPVPPREQRVVNQIHTFPNGVVVKWDGQNWVGLR